ncbi:hypothetical protein HK405_000898, partial [Cladochytrium tenue]
QQQPPPPRRWTFAAMLSGFELLRDGCTRALRSPRARRPLVRSLRALAIMTVVLFVFNRTATLPVKLLRALLVRTGTKVDSGMVWMLDAAVEAGDRCVTWLIAMMPDAGLYFLRYIYPRPLDLVFFESLKTMTTELALPGPTARFSLRFARSLDVGPSSRASYLFRLGSYARRLCKRLAVLFAIYLASKVPVFGNLAWPAATFAFLGTEVGWSAAVWFCGVGTLSPPLWRYLGGPIPRMLIHFRVLCRELVEPYLCRSLMNSKQRHEWFRLYEPVIAGFALP